MASKHEPTELQKEQMVEMLSDGTFTIESARKIGVTVLSAIQFRDKFWTETTVNWCIKSGLYFNTFNFDKPETVVSTVEQFSHPSAWGYVLAKNPVLAVREAA